MATVAMCELEYNFQLFWQFEQEMKAKLSAAEPSRKLFYSDTLTFYSLKEPGKDT